MQGRAAAIAFLVASALLAGCGDRPFEPVDAPIHAPGTWWVVDFHRDAQGDEPAQDETRTFLVVGHRNLNGTSLEEVLAFPGADVQAGVAGLANASVPFEFMLLRPGQATGAGVSFYQEGMDCRGPQACPLQAPALGRLFGEPLPFPLRAGEETELAPTVDQLCEERLSHTVRGAIDVPLPFGTFQGVRVDHDTRVECWECCPGSYESTSEYVAELGLVARRIQDGNSGGWSPGTMFAEEVVAFGRTAEVPTLASIGRAFSLQRRGMATGLGQLSDQDGQTDSLTFVRRDDGWVRMAYNSNHLLPGERIVTSWSRRGAEPIQQTEGNVSVFMPPDLGYWNVTTEVYGPQDVLIDTMAMTFSMTHEGRHAASCSLIACEPVEFPMHPDLRSIQLRMSVSPPGQGLWRLIDSGGNESDIIDTPSGEARFDWQVQEWNDTTGPWQATWTPRLPATSTLQVHAIVQ